MFIVIGLYKQTPLFKPTKILLLRLIIKLKRNLHGLESQGSDEISLEYERLKTTIIIKNQSL
jgi:hypothetical protein